MLKTNQFEFITMPIDIRITIATRRLFLRFISAYAHFLMHREGRENMSEKLLNTARAIGACIDQQYTQHWEHFRYPDNENINKIKEILKTWTPNFNGIYKPDITIKNEAIAGDRTCTYTIYNDDEKVAAVKCEIDTIFVWPRHSLPIIKPIESFVDAIQDETDSIFPESTKQSMFHKVAFPLARLELLYQAIATVDRIIEDSHDGISFFNPEVNPDWELTAYDINTSLRYSSVETNIILGDDMRQSITQQWTNRLNHVGGETVTQIAEEAEEAENHLNVDEALAQLEESFSDFSSNSSFDSSHFSYDDPIPLAPPILRMSDAIYRTMRQKKKAKQLRWGR